MKNVFLASLFTALFFFLTACSMNPILTSEPDSSLVEEQEFILSPEIEFVNLQTASLSTSTPRLVVRLSIQPELDSQGTPTGKRYGQATFFWTDKARSKGGSNLGGTVSITLRDSNVVDAGMSYLTGIGAPIMSNVDLYKQLGYEDHMVKTSPISFSGQLCVEVSSINLLSTNGYSIYHSWEMTEDYDTKPMIRLCDKKSPKSGTDLRLYTIKGRVFEAVSGGEFPLSMAVINSGSSAARDVTVSYKIPYALAISFVEDRSALFDCSSTTETTEEGPVMTVSCYAEKMGVGVQTLPLVFLTTKEAPIISGLFEFYMTVATSSSETDTTNNTADSYVLVY